MKDFDTLLDAINDLKSRGFNLDFKLQPDCLLSGESKRLDPKEFEISEVYRFEGFSNPDDNAVVYGIESHHGDKGILVDAYGTYASQLSAEMIEKLRVTHMPE